MKEDNKLVSVLISVFNAQETISNSLNSILNQTYKNIEILIMDDCSTDNSFDILNSFQLENNKVIDIFKKYSGTIINLDENENPYQNRYKYEGNWQLPEELPILK